MWIRPISRRAALAIPFAAALRAEDDFWAAKPADQWTVEECEKLLADSPWAKTMTVARGALVEGLGAPAPRGRRGLVIARTVEVTIRWMSARPMKEALARVMSVERSRRARKAVERDQAGFIVVVKGLPVNVLQLSGESRATLERSAEIRIPGRDPLRVSRMATARDGATAELRFIFPEEPGLTAADKSAEFRFEMGRSTIKHKFQFDKMRYQGELAL